MSLVGASLLNNPSQCFTLNFPSPLCEYDSDVISPHTLAPASVVCLIA